MLIFFSKIHHTADRKLLQITVLSILRHTFPCENSEVFFRRTKESELKKKLFYLKSFNSHIENKATPYLTVSLYKNSLQIGKSTWERARFAVPEKIRSLVSYRVGIPCTFCTGYGIDSGRSKIIGTRGGTPLSDLRGSINRHLCIFI
jgi:hypothetical protein